MDLAGPQAELPAAEVVHLPRAGQGRHAAGGNLTVITSLPLLLTCSHQVRLAVPWGR